MDRRKFLFNSGLALGASAILSNCTLPSQNETIVEELVSFDTWPDIRKQFLFSSNRIHMSQMLLAAHPKPVRDAIAKHREEFDKNPVEYWEGKFQKEDSEIRNSAAHYLKSDPSEIALTDSTTMGLAVLYNGLKLKPGDEILTTTHDHYATEKSLEFAAAKAGTSLKRVAMYTDPSLANVDEMVSSIKKGLTSKTRVVAITYVHSSTGVKTPVRAIADMIKEANAGRTASDRIYLCVDGVHGFGTEDVSMYDLGCDFFAAGTHKWIFGPRGTGILFGKKDAWDKVAPTIPSFDIEAYGAWLDQYPADKLTFGQLCSPGGFHSFEHRYGLKDAFEFQLKIGKTKVSDRTHTLSSKLKEGLSNIKHIKLITPKDVTLSAGINCFEVEGMKPDDAVKKLLTKEIIASSSPYKVSYVRLTPSIINSEEEVDICLKEVENIKG
ncbi:MAG: aminotransferase class V-fold PLP-dependent enzyme [Bacteroidota bacterium]